VQNQPDETALPMGDGSDALVVSEARNHLAIHNLKNASLGSGSGICNLME
jgi:hypothetical protein